MKLKEFIIFCFFIIACLGMISKLIDSLPRSAKNLMEYNERQIEKRNDADYCYSLKNNIASELPAKCLSFYK